MGMAWLSVATFSLAGLVIILLTILKIRRKDNSLSHNLNPLPPPLSIPNQLPLRRTPSSEVPVVPYNQIKILARLGEGAFGEVFLVSQIRNAALDGGRKQLGSESDGSYVGLNQSSLHPSNLACLDPMKPSTSAASSSICLTPSMGGNYTDEDNLLPPNSPMNKPTGSSKTPQNRQNGEDYTIPQNSMMRRHGSTKSNRDFSKNCTSGHQSSATNETGLGAGKNNHWYDSTDIFAMKKLKKPEPDLLRTFEKEAKTMVKLSHPNIVRFYGLTLQKDDFGLLFEYMERGDLLTYLRTHSPDPSSGTRCPMEDILTQRDLMSFSLQVAKGLQYLGEQNFVHRDLAARNCLLNAENRIKISDFGMSKDVCGSTYYKVGCDAIIPLRWLPPECILYRRFTVESDVWSYGVVLWEIFTYGKLPWGQFSNSEVMKVIEEGQILAQPKCADDSVYSDVMLRTWAQQPEDRITPEEAVTYFYGRCCTINDGTTDTTTTVLSEGQEENNGLKNVDQK